MRARTLGIGLGLAAAAAGVATYGVWQAAQKLRAGFEPKIREEAIRYLSERFNADVDLADIAVDLPALSSWKLWRDKGRGSIARIRATGLKIAPKGQPDLPPLLKVQRFSTSIDLGIVMAAERHIQLVELDGVEIVIPPKGQRSHIQLHAAKEKSKPAEPQGFTNQAMEAAKSTVTRSIPPAPASSIVFDTIHMRNSRLTILPRQRDRVPLDFRLDDVKLTSAGLGRPMNYVATLHNPKPPGDIHSTGQFGPWNSDEPGDSPLSGKYEFVKADLGVFKAIGGILHSTGTFKGTLDSVEATGEARVPNFQLKRARHGMPLTTRFSVLVDGTNGNTILRPVRARLGTTEFTTSGAIVKREKAGRRSIRLSVNVPAGEIADFLQLAIPRDPFLKGTVLLKFTIDVPPLDGKVVEKLILDGTFALEHAKFLQAAAAEKVTELSERGQGHPGVSLGETFSQMRGSFHMEDQTIQFRQLKFGVPGARVDLIGSYDIDDDKLDFHGSLALDAKISKTLTGWKRWAAKPLDPFFAKNGAGTFLKIQVVGSAKQPSFGLDKQQKEKSK